MGIQNVIKAIRKMVKMNEKSDQEKNESKYFLAMRGIKRGKRTNKKLEKILKRQMEK